MQVVRIGQMSDKARAAVRAAEIECRAADEYDRSGDYWSERAASRAAWRDHDADARRKDRAMDRDNTIDAINARNRRLRLEA